MIKNFESVCGNLDKRIETMTIAFNKRVNEKMKICEEILSFMSNSPMRVREIRSCFPMDEEGFDYIYSTQKITAMLQKLIALNLVKRISLGFEEVEVETESYKYPPNSILIIDGEEYVKPSAQKEWIYETVKVKKEIIAYVKIGA